MGEISHTGAALCRFESVDDGADALAAGDAADAVFRLEAEDEDRDGEDAPTASEGADEHPDDDAGGDGDDHGPTFRDVDCPDNTLGGMLWA